jgi:hypothetical protein
MRAGHFDIESLALIGNAPGQLVTGRDSAASLPPRGIFDKETRRKAVAVAGAAMELEAVIGFDREGKEPGIHHTNG